GKRRRREMQGESGKGRLRDRARDSGPDRMVGMQRPEEASIRLDFRPRVVVVGKARTEGKSQAVGQDGDLILREEAYGVIEAYAGIKESKKTAAGVIDGVAKAESPGEIVTFPDRQVIL